MSEVLTHKKPLKHELAKHIRDVLISAPADGEVLTYEAISALWKNKPAPGAAALTPEEYQIDVSDWQLPVAWTNVPRLTRTFTEAKTVFAHSWATVYNYNIDVALEARLIFAINGVQMFPQNYVSWTGAYMAGVRLALNITRIFNVLANDVLTAQMRCPQGAGYARIQAGQAMMVLLF